ncbi:MAG: ATP-binding protein, partial [Rhodoferax sp.]
KPNFNFLVDDIADLLVSKYGVSRVLKRQKRSASVPAPDEVIKEFAGIPPIECFPFQLNQVFMNLLVNASHAIEARGTITLRTGHDDVWVWVEVQDTGRGIKPENLARIFEPFFTTKPVGQGTGLGLSLSYGIVQKHGGRIEVNSELGQGSTFKVILLKKPPVKAVEAEA